MRPSLTIGCTEEISGPRMDYTEPKCPARTAAGGGAMKQLQVGDCVNMSAPAPRRTSQSAILQARRVSRRDGCWQFLCCAEILVALRGLMQLPPRRYSWVG